MFLKIFLYRVLRALNLFIRSYASENYFVRTCSVYFFAFSQMADEPSLLDNFPASRSHLEETPEGDMNPGEVSRIDRS